MTLTELKQLLQQGNCPNLLVFTGPEVAIMDSYINQIGKVFKYPISREDSLLDVAHKLRNKSFLVGNQVFVVRDDKTINEEKIYQSVKSMIKNNILILVYTNLDKRSFIYKTEQKQTVEFEYLEDKWLTKYIKKDLPTLSDKCCKYLIDVCGSDYSRILLEIDKVKHFSEVTNKSYDESLIQLLNEGVIYCEPKDAVFDLVNAIMLRKVSSIYDLYDNCKEYGENNIVILSNVYNTAKQVFQVQTCESKDVAKTTGLTGWQVKQAYNKLNKYSDKELLSIMKLVRKIEKGIKTGLIEDSVSIDYLLIHIL